MLDRPADPSIQDRDALEPLPGHWKELFEGLRDQLSRVMEQREWLARTLERTSLELREQVVELEALRQARSAAESANLVRGEVLATVSRAMRTPADALLGLTRLLRMGALVPAQRAYVEALLGTAEALRRILNDVSDFSRLESGTLPLEPIAFDLRVMLEDLAATLSGEALAKGIGFRLDCSTDTPHRVVGDPGRLRQVLTVLVSDGLSRLAQGEIVMELGGDPAQPAGRGIRVVVTDTGPGISPDLLATLFHPFVRGDAYANRDGGLGLPIARQLAHLMGGDLAVESAVETGSRFTLRFPLPDLEEEMDGFPGARAGDESVPTSALPDGLLVVEADANQRASWASIAEAAGYRVTGCGTREEGLARLRRLAQEKRAAAIVIFSDHSAEDYPDLGREIVGDESLGKPALIMLPAVGNPGDARRLMEAGFRGYLVKPVAPSDLRETLEQLRRTRRGSWHRLFLTRHSLAEARCDQWPKGSSSDGEVGVNSSAPDSVMCMSSSSRTPNSPRI